MTEATAGDIFAALFAAWRGRRACAAHVAGLTVCKVTALAGLHASGHHVSPSRAALALAADAASHYWADRRDIDGPHGLPRLAFAAGKRGFWMLGAPRDGRDDNPVLGTGAHSLDQAWHIGCLLVASLVAAGGS